VRRKKGMSDASKRKVEWNGETEGVVRRGKGVMMRRLRKRRRRSEGGRKESRRENG